LKDKTSALRKPLEGERTIRKQEEMRMLSHSSRSCENIRQVNEIEVRRMRGHCSEEMISELIFQ
jgi:hypothetical protein